ncbi:alpha/beta-hydrolase [Basidiobolus meristosporus CBS 931.73]|uniref:Alpha/beta-hydrolase n=1 Tax=Basidiobolus meristosporus CBS 931.73 TaxID=1314790 RepID=A0A1Y1Y7J9_9FUNG|nr:alpha/beta-hydrolase [Basidiobolus meristosporus CBS 931.73]|eukprot:ORX93554.1 alpha/beta-hydrolase [Basidiobolus meristosporus CBS 931.73]
MLCSAIQQPSKNPPSFLPVPTLTEKVTIGTNRKPITIRYQLFGTGTKHRVLFVTGINSVCETWFPQTQYFGSLSNYQVCTFDLRGSGESTSHHGFFTTKTLAQDALDLLSHLKWDKEVHLVGLSLGGMIAQRMVTLSPEIFATVTLTSTWHSFLASVPKVKGVLFTVRTMNKSLKEITRALVKINYPQKWLKSESQGVLGKTNLQVLTEVMDNINSAVPNQSALAAFPQKLCGILHHSNPRRLRKIAKNGTRFMIVHGTKDTAIPYSFGKAHSKQLGCPLITFEGCGHMLVIQEADKYNRFLQNHIEGREISSTYT